MWQCFSLNKTRSRFLKQYSHKCREKVKKIPIQGKLSKWRTLNFGKKKKELTRKKYPEQGITHVNVAWQYPTQMQNRVQGHPNNT